MIGGLIPLVLVGLVVWLVVRALGSRRADPGHPDRPIDAASAVRRLFLYGLLAATLIVAGQGMVELAREATAGDERSTDALARSLAFLVVGLPAGLGLVWWVDRRLAEDPVEREAFGWAVYLDLALLTTLVAAMVSTHGVVAALLGAEPDRLPDVEATAGAVVWGGLWALHWFGFRRRHGVRGEVDLASGTVAGLLPLTVGTAGLVWIAGDELYRALVDDTRGVRGGPATGSWAAAALIGAAVWGWYWLARYRRAARTELWWVVVLPIGALTGFVAVVAMVGALAGLVAVWFVGDPGDVSAARHFADVPPLTAVLVVGAASLAHHRSFLRAETERNEPIRAYDYLLAGAALVAAVSGGMVVLVALMGIGTEPVANSLITGTVLVAIGTPVWWWFWRRIEALAAVERAAGTGAGPELGSPVRRAYLFGLFGVGGLLVLFSVLSLLTWTFEDVLEGTVDRGTLDRSRFAIAVLVTVTGVAWYHYRVFRAERELTVPSTPAPPGPPPPPPLPSVAPPSAPLSAVPPSSGPPAAREATPRRLVVVSPGTADHAEELARLTGAVVTHWHRSDLAPGAGPDPAALADVAALVADRPDEDLLVVLGDLTVGDGPLVVPLAERELAPG